MNISRRQITHNIIINTLNKRINSFKTRHPLETIKIRNEIGIDIKHFQDYDFERFNMIFNIVYDKPAVLIDILTGRNATATDIVFFNGKIKFSIYSGLINVEDGGYIIIPSSQLCDKLHDQEIFDAYMSLTRLSYDKDFHLIFNEMLGFTFNLERTQIWLQI